jgi:hypothetical protein
MKLPSLIRLPNHTRFNITPRYYDPVKEEIEERISKIKADMAREKVLEESGLGSSAIAGSFKTKSKISAPTSASARQLILALVMMTIAFGWLYYGNSIFYIVTLAFPVFIHFQLKNRIATMSAAFSAISFIGYYTLGWQFPYLREFIVLTAVFTAYFWVKSRLKGAKNE